MGDIYRKFKTDIHRELIVELDGSGIITTISPNCSNVLGYNIDEIIGLNISDFIVEGNIKLEEGNEENFEITLKNKNGENRYFDVVRSTYLNHNQKVMGSLISLIDISRFKDSKKKDEKLLNILELSKDIVYMVQLQPEIKLLYMNSAVEEVLGIKVEDHYQDPYIPLKMTHPDDTEGFIKKMNGEIDYSKPIQARYKNAKGEYIWLEESTIPIYNEQRELVALVGYCRDIQARKELEDKLKIMSYYDSLTGIRNRAYFQKELDNLNTQTNTEIGVIICDLDNLKCINDDFGHLQGDKLLKNFGKIIDDFSSENTVTARIGGDEFAILLKDKSYNFLEDIYSKLLKSIENYNSNNIDLSIKVSTGFAYSQTSIGNTQKIYHIADKKMYQNKLANKNL